MLVDMIAEANEPNRRDKLCAQLESQLGDLLDVANEAIGYLGDDDG